MIHKKLHEYKYQNIISHFSITGLLFKDYSHVVPEFYFLRAILTLSWLYRKAKLKLINNLISKVIKRKTLLPFIQISNHQISSFLFHFYSLKNTLPSTFKTALDDILAYLRILRAITA
jgi:hypothetical protein